MLKMDQFLTDWDTSIEIESKDKTILCQELLDKLEQYPDDVELYWRLVKACLVLADSFEKIKDKTQAKKYIEESFKYAQKAVLLNPKSLQAQKWLPKWTRVSTSTNCVYSGIVPRLDEWLRWWALRSESNLATNLRSTATLR